jgi:hypothetical protein
MNKKLDSLSARPLVLAPGSRVYARANAGAPRSKIIRLPIEEPRTPRLPGYDSSTQRMEMGAFCFLGSIAITLVLLAVGNAARFSENKDAIAAALSSGAAVESANSGLKDTNHMLTNVTAVPTLGRGTRATTTADKS